MDGATNTKVRSCPVCEESVPADTKICPSCSTDLSLFPVDDTSSGDAASLPADQDAYVADLLIAAEAESAAGAAAPVPLVYDDSVECPACGKPIAADAMKCQHCGAEFEAGDVFECPLCKSLIDITVSKCPSCGAIFEDETPAPPQAAPGPAPEPRPEPAIEVHSDEKAAKVSFVDRLKQIKDDPAPEKPQPAPAPKREMSFAERMKAMKDGTLPDDKAAKEQRPAPAAQIQTQPQQQPRPVPEGPQPQPQAQPQPKPAQPAAQPSITDRVQSLKQGTQQPAQQSPAPAPVQPAKAPEQAPANADAGKEGYKELPRYIGEVKKLLLLANELKIDVSTSKALINKAVTAGKTRDLDNAIRLVKEGKAGLERDLKANMTAKLRTLETAVNLEKRSGKNVSAMEAMIDDIRKTMEVADLPQAWESIKKLEETIMKSASGKLSEVEFETISKTIADAEALRLNVSDAKMLYEEARKAAAAHDTQRSSQYIKQAMESLNKVLPAFIAGEMRKAKVTLREVKMMNVDITLPVGILKEANDHVLHGDYCSALGAVRRFRELIDGATRA